MSDLGWSRYIRAEEDAHWGACFEAAAANGLTPIEAEDCDDGSHNCPSCPWKNELPNYKHKISIPHAEDG